MAPTSTRLTVSIGKTPLTATPALAVLLASEATDDMLQRLPDEDVRRAIEQLIAAKAFGGKARQVAMAVLAASKGGANRIYAIGLGKLNAMSAESIRQAAGLLIRTLHKHKISNAAIVVPTLSTLSRALVIEAITTGALLAAFEYEEYKGSGRKIDPDASDGQEPVATALTLIVASTDAEARDALERGKIIADGQNFARTIASRPGNNINPPTLAAAASAMAKEAGLRCRIMDEKELAKLKMGGILGVGAGSIDSPPRLIVLEHLPPAGDATRKAVKKQPPAVAPLLVVGKAITFDTGGISIKPADKMGRMIFDKCGGMAVLGFMYIVSKLKLPIPIIGILSSAENAISERAYRPGDILRMYNGVTVEVTNTDAEGRLVLGDALAWGIESYRPRAVVDLATLTGGVVTALGKTMAGVMGNDTPLIEALTSAGEAAGEKMWRLPVGEDQRDQIRSNCADIMNSAGREAHPLQGAAFLSFFVPADGSVPWAHLDIAGVADTEKELPYYAKGATGWGVRTLLEWATRQASVG